MSQVNDLNWLVPFLIVVPVNVALISALVGLLPAELVTENFTKPTTEAIERLWGSGSRRRLADLGTFFTTSVYLRIQVLAAYLAILIGTLGVMESIKHGVAANLFTYWARKLGSSPI